MLPSQVGLDVGHLDGEITAVITLMESDPTAVVTRSSAPCRLPYHLLTVLLSLPGYIVHSNASVLVHGGEPVLSWFKLNTSVFPFQVSFDVGDRGT